MKLFISLFNLLKLSNDTVDSLNKKSPVIKSFKDLPKTEEERMQKARQMADVERAAFSKYPHIYQSNKWDFIDEMSRDALNGVIYESEDEVIRGYLYGHTLDYEEDLDDGDDFNPDEMTCHCADCSADKMGFYNDVVELALNGKIFYVSNFAVENKYRFKVDKILKAFLAQLRDGGVKYIAFDALSDTQRLLMEGDKPNARREEKYGIKVLAEINKDYGTRLFIAEVL